MRTSADQCGGRSFCGGALPWHALLLRNTRRACFTHATRVGRTGDSSSPLQQITAAVVRGRADDCNRRVVEAQVSRGSAPARITTQATLQLTAVRQRQRLLCGQDTRPTAVLSFSALLYQMRARGDSGARAGAAIRPRCSREHDRTHARRHGCAPWTAAVLRRNTVGPRACVA